MKNNSPSPSKPAGDSVRRLVRGRSILAAAIEAGRPVTRLGILRTSCNPDAATYFEAMEEAQRKAFSKSFLVGDSNPPVLPPQVGSDESSP